MNKKPSKLGQYIRKYRKQHELRQRDLANKSNGVFSQSLVWSVESGFRHRIRNLDILKSLSQILTLPVSKVYQLNGYPRHLSSKAQKTGYIINKQLRKTGLTNLQIANSLHISITTVDSWLRGHLPAFETDVLLFNKFHINIESFDLFSAKRIHKLFNASGTKKFKSLRLVNGYTLNDIYNLTHLNRTRSLIDVEAGHSYNFNVIYHLANLYHIHIREITKHKFSLSQIYKVAHTIGNRLLISRHLKGYSLARLSKLLHNKFSVKELSKIEHDLRPVNIQLIGGLSRVYKISFKIMLNFLGYKLSGAQPNKRKVQNGIKIKKLRLHNHLTLSQVSEMTNYNANRSVLSSCENGNQSINVNDLPYLSNVYNVQLKSLLTRLNLEIKLNNKGVNTSILNKYKV